MTRSLACLFLLAIPAFAGAATSGTHTTGSVAIVGATVVHPELEAGSAVSPNYTVIISADRIQAVGPATTTKVPHGARVIDAHGKWVIPGSGRVCATFEWENSPGDYDQGEDNPDVYVRYINRVNRIGYLNYIFAEDIAQQRRHERKGEKAIDDGGNPSQHFQDRF